jgi:hypothetical protein
MYLEFAAGAGDSHQAASGIGHKVAIMTVANPAVAVVAAAGEVATKRSQTS